MKNILNFAKTISIAIALLLLVFSARVYARKAPAKLPLSPPILSVGLVTSTTIDINVTGAPLYGAPAGFSLHWMLYSDYLLYGWDGPLLGSRKCGASFAANPNSRYSLAVGQTLTVKVGSFLLDPGTSTDCPDVLDCDTAYVFRAFAHANRNYEASDKGNLFDALNNPLPVTTLPCNNTQGCTFTQGYWKTHGPRPTGNNSNVWTVPGLNLGNPPTFYSQVQLQDIFDATPAGGNGLVSLAHQLIAAKLNIANGANPAALGTAITDADNLIGPLVVPPVGSGFISSANTSGLTNFLDKYNNGIIGPGHCQ